MKKLFLFILPLFVFSCKPGVDAHKDAITKLGTDWDTATAAVTSFSGGLTKEIMGFSEQGAAMTIDSMVLSALKGDKAAKYKAAFAAYKGATTDAYTPVQNEMSEFLNLWTEKAGAVNALKEGLTSGKIEGDIPAKIAELTGLVTQGTEKVSAWTAKQTELKTAADAALTNLKSAYEAIAKK